MTAIKLVELSDELDPGVVSALKSDNATDVFTDAHIVIVDDQPANLSVLQAVLGQAGYTNLRVISDPSTVVTSVLKEGADVVLLDLHMPGLDGVAVMKALSSALVGPASVPIVVLTADVTRAAREEALRAGAKDFLLKPLDPTEVVLRIGNLLETRALHLSMRAHNERLEELLAGARPRCGSRSRKSRRSRKSCASAAVKPSHAWRQRRSYATQRPECTLSA